LLSIQYIWIPFWNNDHRIYKNNIWLLPLLSNTYPCPNYMSSSYYSSTGYTVNAYHSRITYIHVMVTLVIQLMLTIVYLRIYNSLLFSIALLYRTMLYTCIHTRMSLDYLSSSTIYYTVPCRLCMLTYPDPWSYLYMYRLAPWPHL